MKKKKASAPVDPWSTLTAAPAVTTVPLEGVLAKLQVSRGQGTVLKQGLLDELDRLTPGSGAQQKQAPG
ncbi:MAG TPA: hypothetical protein VKY74_08850 [Chloroflexia bacterium]|nr:hypothetical protein [Chloroflexia bacterium]